MKLKKLAYLYLRNYITKSTTEFNLNSVHFKFLKYVSRLLLGQGHLFSIKLDVNNKCNLKCKTCYIKKGSEELDLKHIRNLINRLDISTVELMGGEPLLRKDILGIISHIKKKKLKCILFTNATLISKKVAYDLKKSGTDVVITTLISDSENIHDNLTGCKGSWAKTIQGIKNLVEVGVTTCTNTVIIPQNIDDVKRINNFSKKIGSTPLFFRYIPKSKKDPFIITEQKKWMKVRKWLLYEKSFKHGLFVRKMVALAGRNCLGGHCVLSVKSNGDITPCPFINHLVLGNIKNENIETVFKNRVKNKEFIKFLLTPKECADCSLVSICKGGCKAASKIFFGDYNKKDYNCSGPWKSEIPFEKICEHLPFWW